MFSARKVWFLLAAAVLLGALVGTVACWRSHCQSKARQEMPPAGKLVFGDRSDAKYEYIFVLGSHSAIAQRHKFPGYTDKTFFACQELPVALREKAREWGLRKGSATPPFEPPGAWYYMEVLPPVGAGGARPTEFFRDDDLQFKEWLLCLRKNLAVETCQVDRLPSWVAEDPRIMRLLDPAAAKK